jgi:AcrR family transcriptional regulator
VSPRPNTAPAAAACRERSVDDTPARLLDAAERLFAERGFEGTSMRALSERARTSISAAHYHFGGKLELVRAVLLRRIEPMNAHRLDRLGALRRGAAPDPPALEPVLDAFLRPSVEAWRGLEETSGPRTRHILAQLHADPDRHLGELKIELFGPVVDRFVEVLAEILPDRQEHEISLDLHFVVGMLLQVVGGEVQECRSRSPHEARGVDDEMLLRRMVDFAAAGLRAKTFARSSPGTQSRGGA